MASTTSFNWETPDDTDLVKDGAAAIRTLGNSIDTSMTDLLGGTTGQILSKASNSNMDFTWIAQDDSNAIQNAIVDAKGDLIAATAADTPARLAVGTNGQVLTADSTAATGLKWASAASGMNLVKRATFTGVANTGTTFDDVFTSTYTSYLVTLDAIGGATANSDLYFQFRYAGPTTQAANYRGPINIITNAPAQTLVQQAGTSQATISRNVGNSTFPTVGWIYVQNVGLASQYPYINGGLTDSYGEELVTFGNWVNVQRTYTGMILSASAGNIDGTVSIYGLAKA